jgi:hypothetical protein
VPFPGANSVSTRPAPSLQAHADQQLAGREALRACSTCNPRRRNTCTLGYADYAQMGIRPCRGVLCGFLTARLPGAGDAAEKLIMTASCGRRPVVDGQAGEQYASLTRLELAGCSQGSRPRLAVCGAARCETRDTGARPRSRLSGVARGLARRFAFPRRQRRVFHR